MGPSEEMAMCSKAPLQGADWGFTVFKQWFVPTPPLFVEHGQVSNRFQTETVNPVPLGLDHTMSPSCTSDTSRTVMASQDTDNLLPKANFSPYFPVQLLWSSIQRQRTNEETCLFSSHRYFCPGRTKEHKCGLLDGAGRL